MQVVLRVAGGASAASMSSNWMTSKQVSLWRRRHRLHANFHMQGGFARVCVAPPRRGSKAQHEKCSILIRVFNLLGLRLLPKQSASPEKAHRPNPATAWLSKLCSLPVHARWLRVKSIAQKLGRKHKQRLLASTPRCCAACKEPVAAGSTPRRRCAGCNYRQRVRAPLETCWPPLPPLPPAPSCRLHSILPVLVWPCRR